MASEEDSLVKKVAFSYDEIASVLKYDPLGGALTWLVATSPKAPAGKAAGAWVSGANGKKYFSVTYKGRKMAASQVAWLLHYGSWPDITLRFVDGDPANLRITNLKKAEFKSEFVIGVDGVTRRRMHKDQARHYGLARHYDLTLTQYAEMFSVQDGVCAICKKPETAKIPGRKGEAYNPGGVRDLSVDHDHVTGAVRGLLCNACNHVLGEAGDDPARLRAAADYIDFHRKAQESPPERAAS